MNRPHSGFSSPELVDSADFDYIRKLLKDHTAIALDRSKVYLVNSRLLPIARDTGYDSVVALIKHLRSIPFGRLHTRTIEAIVTTETSFFRDFYPFEALRTELIPEIMNRRRQYGRNLSIWSAGCSSGQEPYSIAMMLGESFPELATWDVRLYASDVSGSMLERCRTGLYTQNEVNRGLPAHLLVRYFRQEGSSWRLNSDLRSMVTFFRHNLAHDTATIPQVDIAIMRNVLIYFDAETKRRVLQRVRHQIRRGGFLMLGTAETTLNLDEVFQRRRLGQAVFYQHGDPEA